MLVKKLLLCVLCPMTMWLLVLTMSQPGCEETGQGGVPGESTTSGDRNPVCRAGQSGGEVERPSLLMNLRGQTGWFASPVIVDLDGDGVMEIVAAYYSVYVYSATGETIFVAEDGDGRVYAPHVVADIDADGEVEIVAGKGAFVYVWQWHQGALVLEQGWPRDTTTAGESPEIRGLAADDLDGDGTLEIIASTTQTRPSAEGGAQLFVFGADGSVYQPPGGHDPAWPRYNGLTGAGNDADRNGQGHNGYGCYGLNVGVGNIDDDEELEIIATYDNHHIQAFHHDGVAIDAAPWFSNRASEFEGQRLTWGQFIRWADAKVEEDHYHNHSGTWPHPEWTEWLQWTASPPSVADLDRDGVNEVIGVPNIETQVPYKTVAYGIMVLEGAQGDGARSARRKPGFELLPRGQDPINVAGWYPPKGVPAPAIVDVQGDDDLEIAVSLNDGFVYLFDARGGQRWRFNASHGKSIVFTSEVTVADLNQDGSPELVFTTFGDPDADDAGYLVVLGADGTLLHDIPLPGSGHNGNGNGAPSAPTIGDVDGDGQLEILVQTFDHGLDVFTVPGSSANCLLWATARGGPQRTGYAH